LKLPAPRAGGWGLFDVLLIQGALPMFRFTLAAFIVAASAFAGCASSSSTQPEPSTSVSAGLPQAGGHVAVLTVHGMGCPLCANNVDVQLMKVPGVESVTIDLGTGHVTTAISPTNPPSEAALTKAIADSGFTLVKIEMP
jgi:copper chaperone CopZ